MARIFNIYFSHDSLMRSAIISVRQTPFFTEYTLNHFDQELMSLLPGNKIISRKPEEFIFQNATQEHSVILMDAIIRAVAEHMQATEA